MDEEALVQALDSGKVCSAGLDVFEEEPKIHPGLVRNPNVMLIPHMGTWTVEVSIFMRVCEHMQKEFANLIDRPKPPWRSGRLEMSVMPWNLGN